MANESNEIYRDNTYLITHHCPQNKREGMIVVTFDSIVGGYNAVGFGAQMLSKRRIENICVSHKGNSYYQQLPTEKLASRLVPLIAGKKVFTYGSSLGGYAALYYSRGLNARAFAISPRCSIDPVFPEQMRANHDVAFTHEALEYDQTNPPARHTILYDPLVTKDHYYYKQKLKPAYPNAEVLEIPYARHPVGQALNQGEDSLLKKLLMDFLGLQPFHEKMEHFVPNSANAFSLATNVGLNYSLQAAETAFQSQDWNNVVYYLQSAFQHQRLKPEHLIKLAQAYVHRGQPDQALNVYDKTSPHHRTLPLCLAHAKLLMRLGRWHRAIKQWTHIINTFPEHPHTAHLSKAEAFMRINDHESARNTLETYRQRYELPARDLLENLAKQTT